MSKEPEDLNCSSVEIQNEIINRINENWLKQDFNESIDVVKSSGSSPFRSPSPLRCVENVDNADIEDVKIECEAPEYLPYDFFTN